MPVVDGFCAMPVPQVAEVVVNSVDWKLKLKVGCLAFVFRYANKPDCRLLFAVSPYYSRPSPEVEVR